MTKNLKQYAWMMRILSVVFLATGLLFFFRPEETVYLINVGPKVFRTLEELPMPTEHFWIAIAACLELTRAMICFYIGIYPKLKSLYVIFATSMGCAIAALLFLFAHEKHYFAYMAGAVTDSIGLLLTLIFFIRSHFGAVEPSVPEKKEPIIYPSP